jgi:hypothetical protein
MSKYQKYTILKGDTLDSIASKLFITSGVALRIFHNNHCALPDMIGDIVKPNNILHIPPIDGVLRFEPNDQTYQTIKQETQQQITLSRERKLTYNPVRELVKYCVTTNHSKQEDDTSIDLQYDLSIQWLQKIDNIHLFQIEQNNILYDDQEPDSKVSYLAQNCAQYIYPLQIVVSNTGQFQYINNHEFVKKRWLSHQEHLLKEHNDATSLKYINNINTVITNKTAINQVLQQDLALNFLFFPLYNTAFTEALVLEQNIKIPILQNDTPLLFESQTTLHKQTTLDNHIKITQNGTAQPYAIKNQDGDYINASFYSTYNLDPKTKNIINATAQYYLFLPNHKEVINISIQKIEVI